MGSSGRNCAILDLLLYHHIRHLHGRFSDKFSSQIIFQIFQGKCKLICTMGPACWDPPMLIKLIETWQSLQPWCRAENAVPNAVLCGPPCCPSAVSRIRAWISPAWTSRTEIMRWGFPLYCLTKKKVITFGPKSCEPHSYKTETERDLWRGDIKKCPTVASSLTSETLISGPRENCGEHPRGSCSTWNAALVNAREPFDNATFRCWKKIQNVLVNLPRLHSSSYPYICMWDVLTCGIFYQRHASRDLTSPSRFCWTRRSSLGSGLQGVKQMEAVLAEFLYYTSLWHRQRNGWEMMRGHQCVYTWLTWQCNSHRLL